jgi:hypothetical protein
MDMIAMPKLIPTAQWAALSLAIGRGDTDRVKYLVEDQGLEVDAFLDDLSCMPVLMEALLSNGFASETERLTFLRYLLERGANPNICCRKGYNCLHIAVQQERYIQALDLFLDFKADVNITDVDGANIAYWAIQGILLRKDAADAAARAEHLRVLEKILLLGADLDQRTRYGMNAREWLEHAAPEVQELVAHLERRMPAVHAVTTVQPRFPTHLQYPDLARKIWSEGMSPAGRPVSVYGELLNAVEILRDEAQRNKNAHYGKNHKRMAVFVRDTLVRSGAFDKAVKEQIRSESERLMKASRPYVEDDVYDRLVDQICVYYTQKEDLILYKALAE